MQGKRPIGSLLFYVLSVALHTLKKNKKNAAILFYADEADVS
jgi:hypothetical protein